MHFIATQNQVFAHSTCREGWETASPTRTANFKLPLLSPFRAKRVKRIGRGRLSWCCNRVKKLHFLAAHLATSSRVLSSFFLLQRERLRSHNRADLFSILTLGIFQRNDDSKGWPVDRGAERSKEIVMPSKRQRVTSWKTEGVALPIQNGSELGTRWGGEYHLNIPTTSWRYPIRGSRRRSPTNIWDIGSGSSCRLWSSLATPNRGTFAGGPRLLLEHDFYVIDNSA